LFAPAGVDQEHATSHLATVKTLVNRIEPNHRLSVFGCQLCVLRAEKRGGFAPDSPTVSGKGEEQYVVSLTFLGNGFHRVVDVRFRWPG
jgi:hypothetical protein